MFPSSGTVYRVDDPTDIKTPLQSSVPGFPLSIIVFLILTKDWPTAKISPPVATVQRPHKRLAAEVEEQFGRARKYIMAIGLFTITVRRNGKRT